jgi:hypothetical protein
MLTAVAFPEFMIIPKIEGEIEFEAEGEIPVETFSPYNAEILLLSVNSHGDEPKETPGFALGTSAS